MALLGLNNVSLKFDDQILLDNVNLQLEDGEKVCLIGRNGTGKTTLMKIINGELEPDSGEVTYSKGVKIARLSQEIPIETGGTIFDIVISDFGEPGKLLSEYKKIYNNLKNNNDDLLAEKLSIIQQKIDNMGIGGIKQSADKIISLMNLDPDSVFNDLSVGYKRRVLLAKALINEPDVLMLDEPTNHLDIGSISWIENFFKQYKGTIFFVTHDRVFLKKIATRILDLDRGILKSFSCNYDVYLKRKNDDLNAEEIQKKQFDKKLSIEEEWIRRGVKARTKRNEGRVKALKKMRELRAMRRNIKGSVNINLQETGRTGKTVIESKNINFSYNDKNPIINDFSIKIIRGDKIGIIGPNGSGKSTLLNILLGNLKGLSGTVKIGTKLEIAYFDQTRMQLDENLTLGENIAGKNDKIIFNSKPRHIISYLEDFLFTPEQVKSFVSTLSGGEKNRLLLAKMFTQPANVLVLDEPTNDLDLETIELLEEMLINFEGTILMVSHDREFLNNVVSDVVVFEGNGTVKKYIGGYNDWQKAAEDLAKKTVKKEKKTKVRTEKPRKFTFKEKKEFEEIPGKIELLEKEQDKLHKQAEDPEFYKADKEIIKNVQNRLDELEKELNDLFDRWSFLEEINNN